MFNKYFTDYYLSVGETRDDTVFENCSTQMLDEVQRILKGNSAVGVAHIVRINSKEANRIQEILDGLSNDVYKKILARDYVDAKIIKSVLEKQQPVDLIKLRDISYGLDNVMSGTPSSIMGFLRSAVMPGDVDNILKNSGRVEVVFILDNMNNMEIAKAINNYLSARKPYRIKVFSTDRLLSSYDQAGTLIQSPHDFVRVSINTFTNNKSEEQGGDEK